MELTEKIAILHPYLFSIAYNMQGVIEEAEDIVQDVFEKWILVEQVDNPKAYLARVAVNKSIDRLKELRKHRENYTGLWLPEPYITLEQDPSPTIEYGMLFLLERLSPNERAVFILRESFSESYDSIAGLLGFSPDNCRQLLHRAHTKLGHSKARIIDPETQRIFTEAFLIALQGQDRSELEALLLNDIELCSDGGGKRAAALKILSGLEKVLKFLLGISKLPDSQNDVFEYQPAFVNNRPAALIFRKSTGELDSMQYLEMDVDKISRLLFVRNPDKLTIRKAIV